LKVFVDDFNVHKMTWETHLEHLKFVLLKLSEVNLNLKTLANVNLLKVTLDF
jgi:hypothetical protein